MAGMADSDSDTPSEASSKSTQSIHRMKPWQWLGSSSSYLAVFAVNITASILLFPEDNSEQKRQRFRNQMHLYHSAKCPLLDQISFLCLMVASLGAGCVAAFLLKRATFSAHARSATGYAMMNWFQSLCGPVSLLDRSDDCSFGGILDRDGWHLTFVLSRLILYLIALWWMQLLIFGRLQQLEQSSHRKYCSLCFGAFLLIQAGGALVAMTSLSIFCGCFVLGEGYCSVPWVWHAGLVGILAGICVWVCHILASFLAIGSLFKSLLDLHRVLQRAVKLADTPTAAKTCLKRARRFAASQLLGVSFSMLLTTLVVPFAGFQSSPYADHSYSIYSADTIHIIVSLGVLVQVFDALGNAAAVLLLSGGHRLVQPLVPSSGGWGSRGRSWMRHSAQSAPAWAPAWKAKVEELSMRGMTLNSFLDFYQEDLSSMSGWRYVPQMHKTRDVVRRAIIPLTRAEETAYSVSTLNRAGARRAEVMVTHNWGNNFNDLLAAVISDNLQECSFRMAGQLLREDSHLLREILTKTGRLNVSYWICAFAVNQHMSICHSNPYDRDPLTNELHPVCRCSCVNLVDSDGRSTDSEINKFDDMMYHLASTGSCRQVIAVDQSFDLFQRAWCVAEIAEAKRLHMRQSLKLLSKAAIEQRAQSLGRLDIRNMGASSEKDKELILGKIGSIDHFNAELQSLIFDPKSGLFASWSAMDSVQQMSEVGRLIRWGMADGSGKVWKAWDAN